MMVLTNVSAVVTLLTTRHFFDRSRVVLRRSSPSCEKGSTSTTLRRLSHAIRVILSSRFVNGLPVWCCCGACAVCGHAACALGTLHCIVLRCVAVSCCVASRHDGMMILGKRWRLALFSVGR